MCFCIVLLKTVWMFLENMHSWRNPVALKAQWTFEWCSFIKCLLEGSETNEAKMKRQNMKSLTTLLSDFRKIYSVPKPDSCGLLSYTVTHFGLQNTPPAFQYFMNEVVGHFESFAVYLGDVLVYSDTWASHKQKSGGGQHIKRRLKSSILILRNSWQRGQINGT